MPGPRTSSNSDGAGPAGERPVGARLALITWDDDSPTGGNVYNAALVESLRAVGVDARLVRVGAGWPDGSPGDRARLRAALADSPVALVDGIVAGNAPDEIRAAAAGGRRIVVLVHLPLSDEIGLSEAKSRRYLERERATLAAAYAVLCPSRNTAVALAERYGRPDVIVAPPGVGPAPVAHGSRPPHLLCLGSITPTKNQLGLLAALEQLRTLDWSASIVGSTTASPDYAAVITAGAAGFDGRVRLTGILTGPALEEVWAASDLLVSTSRVETYGLVVTEALAHGIPAVVPAGTGAVEALGFGSTGCPRSVHRARILGGNAARLAHRTRASRRLASACLDPPKDPSPLVGDRGDRPCGHLVTLLARSTQIRATDAVLPGSSVRKASVSARSNSQTTSSPITYRRPGAQGVGQPIRPGEPDARDPIADEDRCSGQPQPVENARGQERRHQSAAALDQHPAQATRPQLAEHDARSEPESGHREPHDLHVRLHRLRGRRPGTHHPQRRYDAVGEQRSPTGLDRAGRAPLAPGTYPRRSARSVEDHRRCRAGPDDHGVDQCPEPVQC